jgi:SAM-dependent methyltransferase
MALKNSPFDQQAHWNDLYTRFSGQEHNSGRSSAFAQHFGTLLKEYSPGRLLELGCGAGEDCQLFAAAGMHSVGLDFSRSALNAARHRLAGQAQFVQQHLPQGLPFADQSFSAVFAHLSLHYFDDATTAFIFSEIHRVIRLNGRFALRVKSVENEFYGQGKQLGRDMYFCHGHVRRFFSSTFLDALVAENTWRRLNPSQEQHRPGYLTAVLQKTA